MNEQHPLELEIARLKAEVERLQRENKFLREAKRDLHETLLKIYPAPKISEEELIESMKQTVPWQTVEDQMDEWIREAKERRNGS